MKHQGGPIAPVLSMRVRTTFGKATMFDERVKKQNTATDEMEKSFACLHRAKGCFSINKNELNTECVSDRMRQLKYAFSQPAKRFSDEQNYLPRSTANGKMWRRHLSGAERNYFHFYEVEIKLEFFPRTHFDYFPFFFVPTICHVVRVRSYESKLIWVQRIYH